MNSPEFDYVAFISYSRADSKVARKLQRRLEWFRIPTKMIPEDHFLRGKRYSRPIYRDTTNLEVDSSDYWENIQRALDQSRFLIVLCSPSSAASEAVELEISHFLQTREVKWCVPVILKGDVTGKRGERCLPPSLEKLGTVITSRNLPNMALDSEASASVAFEAGFTAILSYILGVRREVVANHLQIEERRKRRNVTLLAGCLCLLAISAAVLGWAAYRNMLRVRRTLAKGDYEQAMRLLQNKEDAPAMAFLARSLRNDPRNDKSVLLAFSLLGQRRWPINERSIPHAQEIDKVYLSADGADVLSLGYNPGVYDRSALVEKNRIVDAASLWKREFQGARIGESCASREGTLLGLTFTTRGEHRTLSILKAESGQDRESGLPIYGSFPTFTDDKFYVWTASPAGRVDRVYQIIEPGKAELIANFDPDLPVPETACLGVVRTRLVVGNGRSIAAVGALAGRVLTNEDKGQLFPHPETGEEGVQLLSGNRVVTIGDAKTSIADLDHPGADMVVPSPDGTDDVKMIEADYEARKALVVTTLDTQPPADAQEHREEPDFKDVNVQLGLWDFDTGKIETMGKLTQRLDFTDTERRPPFGLFTGIKRWGFAEGTRAFLYADNAPYSEPLIHPDDVTSIAYHEGTMRFATGCLDGITRIFTFTSGDLWSSDGWVSKKGVLGESASGSEKQSPRDKIVVKAVRHQILRGEAEEWNVVNASGGLIGKIPNPTDGISFQGVIFSPDERYIIVGQYSHATQTASSGSITIYSTADCRVLASVDTSGSSDVFSSEDGQSVVSTFGREMTIWNWATEGKSTHQFHHADMITSICFSKAGTFMASASKDKTVRIWSLKGGVAQVAKITLEDVPLCSAFDDSEQILAVLSQSGVRFYDVGSGNPLSDVIDFPELESIDGGEEKGKSSLRFRAGDVEATSNAAQWKIELPKTDLRFVDCLADTLEAVSGEIVDDSGKVRLLPDQMQKLATVRAKIFKLSNPTRSETRIQALLSSDKLQEAYRINPATGGH